MQKASLVDISLAHGIGVIDSDITLAEESVTQHLFKHQVNPSLDG